MFWILGWVIFGLIIGLIAKWIHPGEEPVGFLPTMGIGIAGSFTGGAINFLLGSAFGPAGFIMSIVGGVLFCYIYTNLVVPYLKKENND